MDDEVLTVGGTEADATARASLHTCLTSSAKPYSISVIDARLRLLAIVLCNL